ncbi:MAG: hypothetical protein P8107_04355, partial [Spirochaetia bacterium]
KKALTGIKRLGYGKAFIISKQTYDIGNTLIATDSNVWLKTAAGPRPLFSSAGSVSPVAVYGDYFIFLRNSSVYVLQIKNARLTRLTMPLHEELNDNGDRYNLRWDEASRRIIFPHSDGTQTACWSIGADGTGLTRLKGEGSAACTAGVEGLYPLETLDKLVQNSYAEWFRSGDSKEYTLEIPSQGAGSLVIRFHFTSSGTYWSDSVSVKSGDKKRLLLESINNW